MRAFLVSILMSQRFEYVVFVVLTALLSALFHAGGPIDRWLVAKHPRVRQLAQAIVGAGFDLPKVLAGLLGLIWGRPPIDPEGLAGEPAPPPPALPPPHAALPFPSTHKGTDP